MVNLASQTIGFFAGSMSAVQAGRVPLIDATFALWDSCSLPLATADRTLRMIGPSFCL